VLTSLASATINLGHAMRDNTIVLGDQAATFQDWAAAVSESAHATQQSLLEAGTAAQVFARQVGFGPEAVAGLTAVAVQLGNIHNLNPAEAMNLLSSAMQGNAQAAQQLGLQLDASTVAYSQLGGATSDVFNLLDPSTQGCCDCKSAPRWQQQAGGAPTRE
jgi:hypothetical protein